MYIGISKVKKDYFLGSNICILNSMHHKLKDCVCLRARVFMPPSKIVKHWKLIVMKNAEI